MNTMNEGAKPQPKARVDYKAIADKYLSQLPPDVRVDYWDNDGNGAWDSQERVLHINPVKNAMSLDTALHEFTHFRLNHTGSNNILDYTKNEIAAVHGARELMKQEGVPLNGVIKRRDEDYIGSLVGAVKIFHDMEVPKELYSDIVSDKKMEHIIETLPEFIVQTPNLFRLNESIREPIIFAYEMQRQTGIPWLHTLALVSGGMGNNE